MMTLLKDPELRKTMGKAAAARAKEKFDVAAMVSAYEELYDEISAPRQRWKYFHFGRKSAAPRENLEV
jgi:hypothetical protein